MLKIMLKTLLERGYTIHLIDPGDDHPAPLVVAASLDDLEALMSDIDCCELMDIVVFKDDWKLGWFGLLWQGEPHPVYDHTDNGFCNSIWEEFLSDEAVAVLEGFNQGDSNAQLV